MIFIQNFKKTFTESQSSCSKFKSHHQYVINYSSGIKLFENYANNVYELFSALLPTLVPVQRHKMTLKRAHLTNGRKKNIDCHCESNYSH